MKTKKYIYLIICLFFLKNNIYTQNFNQCEIKKNLEIEIIKIDSTQDYYMIYAISNNQKLKIITRKCPIYKRNIEVSEKYWVTVASINENFLSSRFNDPCHVTMGFDGNAIYNETEWNCDLYFVYEILGLFYSTNKDDIEAYYIYLENNPLKQPKRKVH